MKNLTLTINDVNYIKENATKEVERDGSIILRLAKFYRFNDVSILISSICGDPYNEIEIHGKLLLTPKGEIDSHFSSCVAEASDEIFELLIN
jgi:hypothetical protein